MRSMHAGAVGAEAAGRPMRTGSADDPAEGEVEGEAEVEVEVEPVTVAPPAKEREPAWGSGEPGAAGPAAGRTRWARPVRRVR
jgi:hypothetical protein